MASYSIGEVEQISGVKTHVLRYWEENVPFLSPQKDSGGRRTYSARDVQFVLRLKHLVQERKFTLEGAVSHLIEEASLQGTNEIARSINLLKTDLLELHSLVKELSIEKEVKKRDEN